MKPSLMIAMLVLLLALLPLEAVFPQLPVYGTVGAGALVEKGEKPASAKYAGVDVSLYRDTASGFTLYSRTIYFYADYGDERDIQSINEWVWPTKSFGLGGMDMHVGIGFGFLLEFEALDDKESTGLGIDLAVDLVKDLSLGFTVLWQPRDKKPDPTALFFKVDLTP